MEGSYNLDIFNPPNDWHDCFLSYGKEPLLEIKNYINKESIEFNDNSIPILPRQEDILNAFLYTSLKNTKVVIIGQDPYLKQKLNKINKVKEPEAMGLSFSVRKGIPIPPSLRNIYNELDDDSKVEFNRPNHGDLTKWAKQGVLLLNGSLSLREGSKLSHMKIWYKFTNHVIKYISDNKKDVIFMLWGNYAKEKSEFINETKHHILKGIHPSPLNGKKFIGCRHFSKANDILQNNKIDWDLGNDLIVDDRSHEIINIMKQLEPLRNYKPTTKNEITLVKEMLTIILKLNKCKIIKNNKLKYKKKEKELEQHKFHMNRYKDMYQIIFVGIHANHVHIYGMKEH